MPIKIDLTTMRQADDKVRLPGEPENQGYLNRRTGEVVFVSDTEQDAVGHQTAKPRFDCHPATTTSSSSLTVIPLLSTTIVNLRKVQ